MIAGSAVLGLPELKGGSGSYSIASWVAFVGDVAWIASGVWDFAFQGGEPVTRPREHSHLVSAYREPPRDYRAGPRTNSGYDNYWWRLTHDCFLRVRE